MKKTFSVFLMTLIFGINIFAQKSDDYAKKEFFAGYSSAIYVDDTAGVVARGFNVSGVYNFTRHLGIKGDVSGTYDKTRTFSFVPGFDNPSQSEVGYKAKSSIYNYVGGIQYKNNSTKARFKPFAHAMTGVGQFRYEVRDQFCTTTSNCTNVPSSETDTGLALVFGGGLDVKVSRRVDIRLIQFDVNSIGFKRSISNRESYNTFRFSAGIVFR